MSPRRVRLRKIAELREKKLGEKVAELQSARSREAESRDRLDQERRRAEAAIELREGLASREVLLDEWARANEWVSLRGLYQHAAELAVARARGATQQAHAQMLAARQDLRRIEVLEKRLAQAEREAAERKDQRLHDELAQQRTARRGSR